MLKRNLVLFFLSILCVSCGRSTDPSEMTDTDRWFRSEGKLRVLATTGMIEDLVEQVGGDAIITLTLIHRELDPHTYELVKGDDEKLQYADLIFANGLGLEHGPSLRSYLEKSENVIRLGDRLREDKPEKILWVDGLPDPHIWTDVRMWRRTVPYIVDALQARLPEHAEEIAARGESLVAEMDRVDREIWTLLQGIPDARRYLVTSHDAFNYFTRRYLAASEETEPELWDKRFEAPEGLAPEAQLSPLDIERIIDHMERFRITVLFPESNVSQDSIRKIVGAGRMRGLELYVADTPLYGDAMGDRGSAGETYLKMALHNARTIAKHLQEAEQRFANGDHKEEP